MQPAPPPKMICRTVLLLTIFFFLSLHCNIIITTFQTPEPKKSNYDETRTIINSNNELIAINQNYIRNNTVVSEMFSEINTLKNVFKREAHSYNENNISLLNDSETNDTYWNRTMTEEEKQEYLEELRSYLYPKTWTWVLIVCNAAVFIVGLVGNALVCVAVYRNHTMRTVTNYFIVNLAVADFLVILMCLPPTVIWDVTSTWFFGVALCKIVLYLQVSFSLTRLCNTLVVSCSATNLTRLFVCVYQSFI